MEFKQNADGSISGIRERDSLEVLRAGGLAGPAIASQNVPGYVGTVNPVFNIEGGTDTGGGLLQWQNNLGYDLLVTSAILDVTTAASTACTASFGAAAGSTTLSTNMINGQDIHTATGTFGGATAVKVANGSWITGSKGGGASAGLVGRVSLVALPSNPTAGGA